MKVVDSKNNGKARQFIAAVIVNLLCLSHGIIVGWSSPIIPQLRSNNPPIDDTPMSEDQISWITNLLLIGGFLTIPFCAILSERIGQKNFAHLTGLTQLISWLLIIFGQNHICLYASRLAGGIGAAMSFFIVPTYVSEIASEEMRGFLGSLLLLFLNIGILIAYVAGAFLPYRLFASLSSLFPLIFLAVFSLMPETPVFYMRRNLQLEANKSMMFFRGNNEALVQQELTKLRSQVKTCDIPCKAIRLSDLFRDRATRKGLIVSFGLMAGQQLSGIFAMMSYAETIFQRAGLSMSSDTAPIIIGAIQIIGSYASTMLMERAGRRLLTLVSCVGMTISHSLIGLFFLLRQNQCDVSSISWLPLAALSAYIVAFCLGIGPVPFVVISELFHLDVSSFATNVCFVIYWAVALIALKSFDLAMKFLGAGGCFFMLAALCASSFVFCFLLLPETKARKREDIVDELAGMHRSCREKDPAVDKNAESKVLI